MNFMNIKIVDDDENIVLPISKYQLKQAIELIQVFILSALGVGVFMLLFG